MNDNKQIWLLLDSRSYGGIETHVLQLARSMIKHHIDVEVIFMAKYGNHPICAIFTQEHIKYRVLKHGLYSLIKSMYIERPRLIHSHGYKAGICARMASLLTQTTVVSTFHSGEIVTGKLAIYDAIDRFSAGLSHALIAVSAPINARLNNQATIVNNFVGIARQSFPGTDIAFVGRLSYEKGPDIYLKLASYFPKVPFHIYGDGPMLEQLANTASDNVHFHGHQDCMDQQWQHIGLVVMPSRQEGLPMAALEAMAHGIPVCAYDVGALNKLIEPNNGWLAKTGDIKTLRNSINQWLGSSIKRNFNRSRQARKKIIVQFSDVATMPIIINCYNKAMVRNHCSHQQIKPRLVEHSHATN
ncbi:MAG: glycosyltransferase family 4 protein [Psychrobium sp.]|nr:glycosyltransferase family 4 protein [Psychrobium sp.]